MRRRIIITWCQQMPLDEKEKKVLEEVLAEMRLMQSFLTSAVRPIERVVRDFEALGN